MSIVEALDILERIYPSRVSRAVNASIEPLRFQGTKEAFHCDVDAQQSPRRLMLQVMPSCFSNDWKSSLVY